MTQYLPVFALYGLSYYLHKKHKEHLKLLLVAMYELSQNRHSYNKHKLKEEFKDEENSEQIHEAIDEGLLVTEEDLANAPEVLNLANRVESMRLLGKASLYAALIFTILFLI